MKTETEKRTWAAFIKLREKEYGNPVKERYSIRTTKLRKDGFAKIQFAYFQKTGMIIKEAEALDRLFENGLEPTLSAIRG